VSGILVTGGCGYVGTTLVPKLVESGHFVRVVDTQWFGNFLEPSKQIEILKKSVEAIGAEDLRNIDYVIHLANIANDPSVELNPVLSWEINALHLTQLLNLCKDQGIRKFLYASSGSVYGVKEEPKVTEDLELTPISVYNKTKMVAERIVSSFQPYFDIYNIRPATVCGYSPRMRFDVVVNMFVWQAFSRGKITVLGGDQVRPNIHIQDMIRVYEHFLEKDEIASGEYNAGFENISIREIAIHIQNLYGVEIEYLPSNDPRSYRQDSSKLVNTGFTPQKTVSDAISELWAKLQARELIDDDRWYTVKTMKTLGLG
jgi:nucleoside-diphosphate-sugar epimerase